MEYLLAVDRKIFLWINNQWSIPPLDFFFSYIITWLGNAGVVIALVSLALTQRMRTPHAGLS